MKQGSLAVVLAIAIAFAAGSVAEQTSGKGGGEGAGPAAPGPTASGSGSEGRGAFGLEVQSDAPLAITSQELEATQRGGQRILVFSSDVVVEQGDLRIESDRLEAFYPEGVKQPDRLVATGGVRIAQGAHAARCDQATYRRSEAVLVCSGNAELQEGADRLRGKVIEFDIDREIVKVRGGASVLIHPSPDDEGDAEPAE